MIIILRFLLKRQTAFLKNKKKAPARRRAPRRGAWYESPRPRYGGFAADGTCGRAAPRRGARDDRGARGTGGPPPRRAVGIAAVTTTQYTALYIRIYRRIA
jgi:hypothetical protein